MIKNVQEAGSGAILTASVTEDCSMSYYRFSRGEMLKFVPSDAGRILEIGCAEGRFGELIKKTRLSEVWGIESVQSAAESAMLVLDKVLVGDIESDQFALPEDYFDCVIFNDVLEHLRDPWTVLMKLRKNLKPEGVVVASIPNIRYFKTLGALLFSGKWEYGDAGILDKSHLRFFTFKSMADLFKKSGYRIQTIEGISKLSWKFKILNLFFLKSIEEMGHAQAACVAKKR